MGPQHPGDDLFPWRTLYNSGIASGLQDGLLHQVRHWLAVYNFEVYLFIATLSEARGLR